ncbi:MAG: signal recognition particle-docking protein FtsY [Pseudomonadota bacterium]
MFNFFKKKKDTQPEATEPTKFTPDIAESAAAIEAPPSPTGWFSTLKQRLQKTRANWIPKLRSLFRLGTLLDEEFYESLEHILLQADVGVDTSDFLIAQLKAKDPQSPAEALNILQNALVDILVPYTAPLTIPRGQGPFVILLVGVNGNGKTTTAAKLAYWCQQQGHSVMLAAGDTFRAAAVAQLSQWAERLNVPMISQGQGADSAAVIFDALQSATAKGIDVLIADTAGRLHTRHDLMQELDKVQRVLKKLNPDAPHEIMLVLDANTGQNAITQVRSFHDKLNINSLCFSKLDGTAKGGAMFAIAQQCKLPIRFIGVGEQPGDLQPFDAHEFVSALLSMDTTEQQEAQEES